MSIEDLRARRRELLARKKYELELQAADQGDPMALFMVQEELMDVNAQLRSLSPSRRVGSRTAHNSWAADRQQYEDWRQAETALDEEIDAGRDLLRQAAVRGLEKLSLRQRKTLELIQAGRSQTEIAEQLKLSSSTVSRTLARAKKHVRQEAERAMTTARLRSESTKLDLTDPLTARVVLSALTPKQAVYFYLYYSEWLSLREIGELTGTDHTTILRTLGRALRNIGAVLGGREAVLEHPEALEDLAWLVYCDMAEHPERLPEGVPPPLSWHGVKASGDRLHSGSSPTASLQDLLVRVCGRPKQKKPPGRLLAALLERGREISGKHPVFLWLEELFRQLKKRLA